MTTKHLRIGLVLALSTVLTACGGGDAEELQQWMNEQRNLVRPKIVPIAEPKVFEPQAYEQLAAVDPFSKEKLTQALQRDGAQSVANGALVAPELARRKQPLEAFPLDAMTMVGSMIRDGKPVALVKVFVVLMSVSALYVVVLCALLVWRGPLRADVGNVKCRRGWLAGGGGGGGGGGVDSRLLPPRPRCRA